MVFCDICQARNWMRCITPLGRLGGQNPLIILFPSISPMQFGSRERHNESKQVRKIQWRTPLRSRASVGETRVFALGRGVIMLRSPKPLMKYAGISACICMGDSACSLPPTLEKPPPAWRPCQKAKPEAASPFALFLPGGRAGMPCEGSARGVYFC